MVIIHKTNHSVNIWIVPVYATHAFTYRSRRTRDDTFNDKFAEIIAQPINMRIISISWTETNGSVYRARTLRWDPRTRSRIDVDTSAHAALDNLQLRRCAYTCLYVRPRNRIANLRMNLTLWFATYLNWFANGFLPLDDAVDVGVAARAKPNEFTVDPL